MGKSPNDSIRELSKRFNASERNAKRLVLTETAAIAPKARDERYKDLYVEKVRVLGTLDLKTCSSCGDMDGKILTSSESKIGITAPPYHPNCRRITTPYFDDMDKYGERIAKDNEGKTFYVDSGMSYEEWKNAIDNESGPGTVDLERKKEL